MERNSSKGKLFARYLWLYDLIVRKGPISYESINYEWVNTPLNDEGEPLPHKTFENHRKAIEDLFNVSIECDRSNNTYYIDPDTSISFINASKRMLNGALLFFRLQTTPRISQFIRPEHIDEDLAMVFAVIEAIEDQCALKIQYRHNYDPSLERDYTVKPIALKQFRCR